jgi:hypothetical protein
MTLAGQKKCLRLSTEWPVEQHLITSHGDKKILVSHPQIVTFNCCEMTGYVSYTNLKQYVQMGQCF